MSSIKIPGSDSKREITIGGVAANEAKRAQTNKKGGMERAYRKMEHPSEKGDHRLKKKRKKGKDGRERKKNRTFPRNEIEQRGEKKLDR